MRYRKVKVWQGSWFDRWKDATEGRNRVKCGRLSHPEDSWFRDCEHTPLTWDYVESARALCNEEDAGDADVLDVIASVYFELWALHRRQGASHVEQWPLALVVLAGLREAGYEVVKKESS